MNFVMALFIGAFSLPVFANSLPVSTKMNCEAEFSGHDEKNNFQIVTQQLSLTYQDLDILTFETIFAEQSFSVAYHLKSQEITLRVIETLNPQNGLTSLGGLDASGLARLAVIRGSKTLRLTCQRH